MCLTNTSELSTLEAEAIQAATISLPWVRKGLYNKITTHAFLKGHVNFRHVILSLFDSIRPMLLSIAKHITGDGIEKVRGSTPLISTSQRPPKAVFFFSL